MKYRTSNIKMFSETAIREGQNHHYASFPGSGPFRPLVSALSETEEALIRDVQTSS